MWRLLIFGFLFIPTLVLAVEPVSVKDYYKDFSMLSPVDDQKFQNQRKIQVTITIKPALRKHDTVQLYVDGVHYGVPQKSNIFYLNDMSKGSHLLYVKLIGEQGQTIKQTDNVTIHIHSTRSSPSLE